MSYIPNFDRQLYILMLICITVGAGLAALGHHLFYQAPPLKTAQTLLTPQKISPYRHYIVLYSYNYAAPAAYPSAGPINVVRRSGVIAFSMPTDAQILKIANLHKPIGPTITSTYALGAIQVPDLNITDIPSEKWVNLTYPESPEPPQ